MRTIAFLFGIAFGALVTLAGFTHYDVIHQGLLLHSARIFLIMGSTVLTATLLLWLMERSGWVTPLGGKLNFNRSSIQIKHLLGGVTFGIGWAISGTCPAVSAAMLGSGYWMGGIVMIGLLIGTFLRDFHVQRASRSGMNVTQPDSQQML